MPESPEISSNPFLGDLDIPKLRNFLQEKGGKDSVYLVMLTLTNNNFGG
jgi:tryptophanase